MIAPVAAHDGAVQMGSLLFLIEFDPAGINAFVAATARQDGARHGELMLASASVASSGGHKWMADRTEPTADPLYSGDMRSDKFINDQPMGTLPSPQPSRSDEEEKPYSNNDHRTCQLASANEGRAAVGKAFDLPERSRRPTAIFSYLESVPVNAADGKRACNDDGPDASDNDDGNGDDGGHGDGYRASVVMPCSDALSLRLSRTGKACALDTASCNSSDGQR